MVTRISKLFYHLEIQHIMKEEKGGYDTYAGKKYYCSKPWKSDWQF